MQLAEFIEEVLARIKLPRTHEHFIPPYYGPLMIDAAERKLPWLSDFYNDHPGNYQDFLDDTWKLGGLCAWVGPKGELLPLIYGGHSAVRDCFIDVTQLGGNSYVDRHYAHVSVHDTNINECIRHLDRVTDKQMHVIYRFMMTVYMLPQSQAVEKNKIPYRWAMPAVAEINRNPRFERDIVKPFSTEEWEHMTSPNRLVNDLAAASYWSTMEEVIW